MYRATLNEMIERVSDGARIPVDPDNLDYQEYLKWEADGNTLLPYESPETLEVLRNRALEVVRQIRAPMLNAVTGIGVAALIDNNPDVALEANIVRQKLLEITDDADLNAATSYEEMGIAGMAAFLRIAKSVSPAFSAVFKEIKE